jgi:hypothetical protein
VIWDLAPHDLSILDFVLPEGVHPVSIAARGKSFQPGRERPVIPAVAG